MADIKSPNGKPMTITHEINVRVLSQKRQQELTEPLCPSPDVHQLTSRCATS